MDDALLDWVRANPPQSEYYIIPPEGRAAILAARQKKADEEAAARRPPPPPGPPPDWARVGGGAGSGDPRLGQPVATSTFAPGPINAPPPCSSASGEGQGAQCFNSAVPTAAGHGPSVAPGGVHSGSLGATVSSDPAALQEEVSTLRARVISLERAVETERSMVARLQADLDKVNADHQRLLSTTGGVEGFNALQANFNLLSEKSNRSLRCPTRSARTEI